MVVAFCLLTSFSIIGCGGESNTDRVVKDVKKTVDTVKEVPKDIEKSIDSGTRMYNKVANAIDGKNEEFVAYANQVKAIQDKTNKAVEVCELFKKQNLGQFKQHRDVNLYVRQEKEIIAEMAKLFSDTENKLKKLGNPPNEQSERLLNAIIEYNNSRLNAYWTLANDFDMVHKGRMNIKTMERNKERGINAVEQSRDKVKDLFIEAGL